ncbi:MAG: DUF5998 family protein [Nostocoides sp.]
MAKVSPSSAASTPLPTALTAAITRAGYFPALVCDVVDAALGGEEVRIHLVHQETTFDRDVVRRHVTVLVVTDSRLVIAHADDHADERLGDGAAGEVATATTESIALSAVRTVMLAHVVPDPARYRTGTLGRELTLTLGWGAVSRIDLLPATCGDASCEADHGYEGTVSADDISLRISAAAEGDEALREAIAFARHLSGVVGR